MFTLWYLYKGYEELRKNADKLIPTDTRTTPTIPTPTVTPPTPTPPAPIPKPVLPTPIKPPSPEKQSPPKPTPEKSSPIQIPEKKQEDLRPKSNEDLKLSEGLTKPVISPIDDEDLLLSRPKVPEQRPKVEPEPKKTPVTPPVKEQPQWTPVLKPEEPKKPSVTIPQWDSFPKPSTPKKEDFANFERSQEALSRGEESRAPTGPPQEFYQRQKDYVDSSDEEEEEEDDDEDPDTEREY